MRTLAISLLLVGAVATRAHAATAADADSVVYPRAVLSKVYTPTLGEMIAQTITEVLGIMKPIDAPILAVYERDEKKIELSVMGGRSSVDAAKQALDDLRAKGYPLIGYFVGADYHASLDDTDVTLIYLNRFDGYKEVVRRENGRYVVPE